MTFSSLRKQADSFKKLQKKIQESSDSYESEDTFVPGTDKGNRGYCIVRFLPQPEEDDAPFVTYKKFDFKIGTKRYNQKSLRSIDEKDPVQDYKNALYNANSEFRKKLQGKEINVTYVYVVEDKENPDNKGKILKWYMPKTIKNKILEAIEPEEDPYGETPEPINPFDIFGDVSGGRNFILRIKEKDGFRNYEDSKFADSASCMFTSDNEDELSEMYKETVKPLDDVLKPDSFKSYRELLKSLVEVVGINAPHLQDVFGGELDGLGGDEEPKEPVKKSSGEKSEAEKEALGQIKESKKVEPSDDEDDDPFDGFDFDDD